MQRGKFSAETCCIQYLIMLQTAVSIPNRKNEPETRRTADTADIPKSRYQSMYYVKVGKLVQVVYEGLVTYRLSLTDKKSTGKDRVEASSDRYGDWHCENTDLEKCARGTGPGDGVKTAEYGAK